MTTVTQEDFFKEDQSVSPIAPGLNVSVEDFMGGGEVRFATAKNDEEQLNFLQRVMEDLDKRSKLASEIEQAVKNGEQSAAEGILQSAGKVGAGAVLDFLGEVVVSGGRGLSAITPDIIENPLKEGATSAGRFFLETAIGRQGLDAAGS